MKGKGFEVLQKIGKTFMLPIALLPIAGLMLGVSSAVTTHTSSHSFLFKLFSVINDCGNIVFAYLPLLFAVSIALGMANKVKEVAALSAVVGYFFMYASLTSMISNFLDVKKLKETLGLIGDVVGFHNTMNTGVLGGIIIGLVVAALHNKFYKIELPDSLSFFGGTRFVPIISAIAGVVIGVLLALIWPYIGAGIAWLGAAIASLGVFGTFIYGYIYRALIPLGLHHVFYMPFWQTALGGTATINGHLVEGAQNIAFAQISAGKVVSPEAAKYFSGMFPFMIFGFPAAALAMYRQAKPNKKKEAKGLLFSSAITSIVTGVTEPLEFSFLFASPLLYFGVHCVLAAFSFALMNFLKVGVVVSFSGGLIDLFFNGILPGQDKTNWIPIIIVGVIYAIVYYTVFTFFIKKFNLKTPGREEDDEETKIFTKKDYLASKETANLTDKEIVSYEIVSGLGGTNNLVDVDNCATRLRVTVKDGQLVNQSQLKSTGAAGVVVNGNGVQVIYGPKVANIKTNVDEFIATGKAPKEAATHLVETTEKQQAETQISVDEATNQVPVTEQLELYSVAKGKVVPIEQVNDVVFAQKMMGDGYAVIPENGEIYSPVKGEIMSVFPTKHAIGIKTDTGVEVLLHMGINTVELEGAPFEIFVKDGDKVEPTTKLATVDLQALKDAGKGNEMIVVLTNMDKVKAFELAKTGNQAASSSVGTVEV